MNQPMPFSGFPVESLDFLKGLAANNNREWFKAHEEIYRRSLLAPAQAFVFALGERLRSLSPGITYDLGNNGSILRIYRDIRFSVDKTPYNPNLRVVYWEGKLKKTENPAFYFEIEGDKGMLFVGQWMFSKEGLDAFRQAVVDPVLCSELMDAIDEVKAAGEYQVGGETYKRVPSGYPAIGERAYFLRYSGLYAMSPKIPAESLTSAVLVDECFEHCRAMAPIHRWLVSLMSVQSS